MQQLNVGNVGGVPPLGPGVAPCAPSTPSANPPTGGPRSSIPKQGPSGLPPPTPPPPRRRRGQGWAEPRPRPIRTNDDTYVTTPSRSYARRRATLPRPHRAPPPPLGYGGVVGLAVEDAGAAMLAVYTRTWLRLMVLSSAATNVEPAAPISSGGRAPQFPGPGQAPRWSRRGSPTRCPPGLAMRPRSAQERRRSHRGPPRSPG